MGSAGQGSARTSRIDQSLTSLDSIDGRTHPPESIIQTDTVQYIKRMTYSSVSMDKVHRNHVLSGDTTLLRSISIATALHTVKPGGMMA